MTALDAWIQSLRADSSRPPRAGMPGQLTGHRMSGNLAKIMTKLRMNCPVDPQEATRIKDQISRAEARYASYEKEIPRLKRIVAACPPPNHKIPVASGEPPYIVPSVTALSHPLSAKECRNGSKPCTHACCDPSLRPPRASTEMLRLRRIIQHLQLKSREISLYLKAKRCLVSPIRRLPPELLEIVFSFAIIPDQRNTSSMAAGLTALGAIRLTHVCSYWRAIALKTRRLWATILLRQPQSKPQSSIDQLDVYSSHAKSTPLTIRCYKWPARQLVVKLAQISHRWHEINLTIPNHVFGELLVVRHKIPLLRSLCIHIAQWRDGAQTNDTFQDAPQLRRVVLTVSSGHIWPFSFILPFDQITLLTLSPISLSVFSECIRNCPRLFYFNAVISPRLGEVVQQMAELRSPLHKLVLQGRGCQEVIVTHSFPRLLSLAIDLHTLHPELCTFLARSSRLEMLSMRASGSLTTENLVALLLATPSLRILHFRDSHTAMVTPRFHAPLVAPPPDDPFTRVEMQSLAEMDVESIAAFDEVALLAWIQWRAGHAPSYDPNGIETTRLHIENLDIDPEAELDYLDYLS
ncbi:hypothetical protein DFH06DRAFT_1146289 [Mycena polygramma]|nr:hypothetical protein DFH06DRAFT_1146289 [Mycena polygramma]